MIDSIHNVDVNFYRTIAGNSLSSPTLTLVTHRSKTVVVPIIHSRASAYGRTEIPTFHLDSYPTISILNFVPEVNNEWANTFWQDYYGGYDISEGNTTGVDDIVHEIPYGLPLEFRYEVNFAAKSESEFTAMKDYFFKNFKISNNNTLLFNSEIVSLDDSFNRDTLIGDPVWYTMEMVDVPRTDGVLEGMVIFHLKVSVDAKDPVVMELLTRLVPTYRVISHI